MSTKDYFTRLNNVFHGIIAIPLLVFVYIYLEFDRGSIIPVLPRSDNLTISIVFNVLCLGYFGLVFSRFNGATKAITVGGKGLLNRLEEYSKRSIQFYLSMSIPGVIAIVAIMLTGNLGISFVYIIGLFLLSVKRPGVHTIVKDLKLKGEERQIVLKKKDISTAR